MSSLIGSFLLKLAPGAIATVFVGGLGFYLGAEVKRVEVEKLQAQLAEYRSLGERVTDLKASIEASVKDKNRSLVDAYVREIDKVRADFGQAREGLAEATDVLKRGGVTVKNSAERLKTAIGSLPVGSPEREAKIEEALAILVDKDKLTQLCSVTPVADAQLVKLKESFSKHTP